MARKGNMRGPVYITENEPFSKRLRSRREELGLTQQQIADSLHVTRQMIGLYEKGQAPCSTDELPQLARMLGVSIDWIIGLSDVMSPKPEKASACSYTKISDEAIQSIADMDASMKLFFDALICNEKFEGTLKSMKEYGEFAWVCGDNPSDVKWDLLFGGMRLNISSLDLLNAHFVALVEKMKPLLVEACMECFKRGDKEGAHDGEHH